MSKLTSPMRALLIGCTHQPNGVRAYHKRERRTVNALRRRGLVVAFEWDMPCVQLTRAGYAAVGVTAAAAAAVEIPRAATELRMLSRALDDRSFIMADLGLRKLERNKESYWSATASMWEPRGTHSGRSRFEHDRDADTFGMLHGEIRRAFPHVAPIVALHGSSPHGVPLYAVENGRYHLERGARESAARLWRCTLADVADLTPDDVPAFVDAQRERWHLEARAAYQILTAIWRRPRDDHGRRHIESVLERPRD